MTVTESSGAAPTFAGPSLSPSRAADFKTCPLLFRFRTIDRLPEQSSPDQVRGTLVHAVLERLFDLPPIERTPAAAAALVEPQWLRLLEEEPELATLFEAASTPVSASVVSAPSASTPVSTPAVSAPFPAPAVSAAAGSASIGPLGTSEAQTLALPGEAPGVSLARPGLGAADDVTPAPTAETVQAPMLDGMPLDAEARLEAFFASARRLLDGYFTVEDPSRLEPAEREALVSTLVDDQLLIRGYIDRLDVSPAGDLRVVDYKTGGAPREAFEGRALFQLKFYALVLWRTRGVVPRVLRLLYLKDEEICDYSPDAEELERFERTLLALSQAIESAKETKDFRPKPSKLCGWCSHQALCPAFGGTPPPFPVPVPTPTAIRPEDLLAEPDRLG